MMILLNFDVKHGLYIEHSNRNEKGLMISRFWIFSLCSCFHLVTRLVRAPSAVSKTEHRTANFPKVEGTSAPLKTNDDTRIELTSRLLLSGHLVHTSVHKATQDDEEHSMPDPGRTVHFSSFP